MNSPHYWEQNGSDSAPQRTLYDYWAMFRERIWGSLAIFLAVFGATILYTVTAPELYRGINKMRIMRDDPEPLSTGQPSLDFREVMNVEDFNSQISFLETVSIIKSVANRLEGDTYERFMEPYENGMKFFGPVTPFTVLHRNRTVKPLRQSLIVTLNYYHPDPEIAAIVANFFADEFKKHSSSVLEQVSLDAIDDLKIESAAQLEEVRQIDLEITDYFKETGTVSISDEADILKAQLRQLSTGMTDKGMELDTANSRWNQVQTYRAEGRNLWDLAFISSLPRVQDLLTRRSSITVDLAALVKELRAKHPRMIQKVHEKAQVETELRNAVDSAVAKVEADFEDIKSTHERIQTQVEEKELEVIALAKLKVPYDALLRKQETAIGTLDGITGRLDLELSRVHMKRSNVVIFDKAITSLIPASPNILLNISLGFIGGAGLALLYVFAFGVLDERVRTATVVESQLHLPLLSVVPRTIKMDSYHRACLSASNLDRRVTEAFRTVYSNLRIQEATSPAQVILVTSTVPSEGKTFVATNLAITCASHGEKTLIIDADLRIPAIAQSLGIETQVEEYGGGLAGYFGGRAAWDSIIMPDIYPGLDVLGSTRRGANPSEIVNSAEFAEVINVLRESYDRIILDTPPMGVVSDALSMSPLADGCIYVIKHNFVKIRQIRTNLKRMREAAVPVLGALMNNVGKSSNASYSSNQYSYGYARYYADSTIAQESEPVVTPRSARASISSQV